MDTDYCYDKCFCSSKARADWVKEHLEDWKRIILEGSGVYPPSLEIVLHPSVASSGRHWVWNKNDPGGYGVVAISFLVPGRIIIRGVCDEIERAIVNEVRKQIALLLLERFPAPFDLSNPPLIAGTKDKLGILGAYPLSRDEGKRTLVLDGIRREIEGLGGALGEVLCSNWSSEYMVELVWGKDTPDECRWTAKSNIATLIAEETGRLVENILVFFEVS